MLPLPTMGRNGGGISDCMDVFVSICLITIVHLLAIARNTVVTAFNELLGSSSQSSSSTRRRKQFHCCCLQQASTIWLRYEYLSPLISPPSFISAPSQATPFFEVIGSVCGVSVPHHKEKPMDSLCSQFQGKPNILVGTCRRKGIKKGAKLSLHNSLTWLIPVLCWFSQVSHLQTLKSIWGLIIIPLRKIKNEFMTHWDGLMTKPGERILVLAATNRPFDLDEAIIGRFERRIMVGLPSVENREKF
ncbi:hypothetical protein HN51_022262 [Arachis hypogaea]